MNEEEKSYYAGIIDGEGYIGAHTTAKGKKYKYNDIRLIIGLKNDFGILSRLKEVYGGNLRLDKRGMIYYSILGLACQKLLISIKPYVKIKKRQLDLALQLRKTKIYKGKTIPKKVYDKRIEIGERIKNYNQNTGFGYQVIN
jgi:hypothetical protein